MGNTNPIEVLKSLRPDRPDLLGRPNLESHSNVQNSGLFPHVRKHLDHMKAIAKQTAINARCVDAISRQNLDRAGRTHGGEAPLAPWVHRKLVLYRAGKEYLQPSGSDYIDVSEAVEKTCSAVFLGCMNSERSIE